MLLLAGLEKICLVYSNNERGSVLKCNLNNNNNRIMLFYAGCFVPISIFFFVCYADGVLCN